MEEWRMQARNQARRLVQVSNRGRSNSINIGANESHDHALLKFEIGFYLAGKGFEFYTECIWGNGGGRADIFVLDNSECIEVLVSELWTDSIMKVMKYPANVHLNPVYNFDEAKKIIDGWE